MNDTFTVNAGSDLSFSFQWPNGLGGFADLTGWTVDAVDVHSALEPVLSVTLVEPATGTIAVRIDWADTLPMGRVASFRLRIAQGGNEATSNQLWIKYQRQPQRFTPAS